MKKLITLLLALTLVFTLTALPASAESVTGSSGSMVVSYSLGDTYCIILPEMTCTGTNNVFDITAEYVHLSGDKQLIVAVDADQTLTDGNFYLKCTTIDKVSTMQCDICVTNSNGSNTPMPYNISDDNTTLAVFRNGDTNAYQYGRMALTLYVNSDTTAGNYVGHIYYTITIE